MLGDGTDEGTNMQNTAPVQSHIMPQYTTDVYATVYNNDEFHQKLCPKSKSLIYKSNLFHSNSLGAIPVLFSLR